MPRHGVLFIICSAFLLMMVVRLVAQSVRPGPAIEWSWVDPYPVVEDLYDVTSQGGTIVVVGDKGSIAVSTDGANWALGRSGTKQNLRSVAWAQGEFLAGGEQGTLLASRDGLHWENRNFPSSTTLSSISSGAGLTFVTAQETNENGFRIYRSSDNRTFVPDGLPSSGILSFAKDRFFLVTRTNSYWSLDGQNWTSATQAFWGKVLWNGTSFLSHSEYQLLRSADGLSWTNEIHSFTHGRPHTIASHGNSFIAVTDLYGYLNTVGGVVVAHPLNPMRPHQGIHATHSTGDLYITVGHHGTIGTSLDGKTFASPPRSALPGDLSFFESRQLFANHQGYFALVGQHVLWSADGRSWLDHNGPENLKRVFPEINLAVGQEDRLWAGQFFGEWSDFGILPGLVTRSVHDLAAIDSHLYVSMLGKIMRGTLDRIDSFEEVLSVPGEQFTGVRPITTGMLAVTFSGKLYSSPNGTNWNLSGNAGFPIFHIAGNGEHLVAVSPDAFYTSEDGIGWKKVSNIPGEKFLLDVSWEHGHFLVSGGDHFFRSKDGVNWLSHALPVGGSVATKDGRSYVALTPKGTLHGQLQDEQVVLRNVRITETHIQFSFSYDRKYYYQLFSSPDLINWTMIGEYTSPPETGEIWFASPRSREAEYYAVKTIPQ